MRVHRESLVYAKYAIPNPLRHLRMSFLQIPQILYILLSLLTMTVSTPPLTAAVVTPTTRAFFTTMPQLLAVVTFLTRRYSNL